MAICTICGFATEFLKQHMGVHSDKRTFKCDICEKKIEKLSDICHKTWTFDNWE